MATVSAKKAAGKTSWSPERRARFVAEHPPQPTRKVLTLELAELRDVVAGLTERVAALEARPSQTQVVEWRPNHRRITDGGRHAKAQRRSMGIA